MCGVLNTPNKELVFCLLVVNIFMVAEGCFDLPTSVLWVKTLGQSRKQV